MSLPERRRRSSLRRLHHQNDPGTILRLRRPRPVLPLRRSDRQLIRILYGLDFMNDNWVNSRTLVIAVGVVGTRGRRDLIRLGSCRPKIYD